METIVLRAGSIKKKKFNIEGEAEKLIQKLSKRYGMPPEELIHLAFNQNFVSPHEDTEKIKALRREINNILSEIFVLESKWAAIRYRAYTIAKENKSLAITLTGHLGENKTLRRILKRKKEYREVQELVDYYLWL